MQELLQRERVQRLEAELHPVLTVVLPQDLEPEPPEPEGSLLRMPEQPLRPPMQMPEPEPDLLPERTPAEVEAEIQQRVLSSLDLPPR